MNLSIKFLPEFSICHSVDLFPLFLWPQGEEEERKEIGIFLIKMQLYKYFFHLLLHKLNITLPRLDLRWDAR